jgi:16S rRNA (adenine1518-N6/adenine1519-N6)-dimethyltransferase
MPIPDFEDPRRVLSRHGLLPKRGMSQNFLTSRNAVEAIVRAAALAPNQPVVELGAGLGTLTAELARSGARVLAIDRDPDMLRVLEAELAPHGVQVRRADAATIDYAEIAAELGAKLCVVGNLPYAITGAILKNLVRHRGSVARALVMVQSEVGDRLLAQPDSPEYGALTVFTHAAFTIEKVLRLAPGNFHPPPRVHSSVIRVVPRPIPLAEETDAFRLVVQAAFQRRRKTLRNALAGAVAVPVAEAALASAGIDPGRRGETLSVEEFAALAHALERVMHG